MTGRALALWLALAGCATTPTVTTPAPALTPTDELSQADVQRTIQAHSRALRACTAAHRSQEPDSGGKALVQFHVQPSGDPSDIDVRGDATGELARCLKDVFTTMHFRPHRGDPEPILWPMKY